MPRSEIAEIVKKVDIDTLGINESEHYKDAEFVRNFKID
jgi:hypothetical protein